MIFYVSALSVANAQALVQLVEAGLAWKLVIGKSDGQTAFFEVLPDGVVPLREYLTTVGFKWTEREREVRHG